MLHPVRTLAYGLLIEPIVELWRRVADLVSPSCNAATTVGESVLLIKPGLLAFAPPGRVFPFLSDGMPPLQVARQEHQASEKHQTGDRRNKR